MGELGLYILGLLVFLENGIALQTDAAPLDFLAASRILPLSLLEHLVFSFERRHVDDFGSHIVFAKLGMLPLSVFSIGRERTISYVVPLVNLVCFSRDANPKSAKVEEGKGRKKKNPRVLKREKEAAPILLSIRM